MTFLEFLEDETLSNELLENMENADLESEEECVEFVMNAVKKHGVEVTEDEIQSFLDKQPLSDEELDQVSGGAVLKASFEGTQDFDGLMKLTSAIKSKGRLRGRSRERARSRLA